MHVAALPHRFGQWFEDRLLQPRVVVADDELAPPRQTPLFEHSTRSRQLAPIPIGKLHARNPLPA